MRSFTLLITVIFLALSIAALVVAEWVSPFRTGTKRAARAATPTVAIAVSCAPDVDGICVTVDGQTIDIPGDVQVTRYSAGTVGALNLAKNRRPSAVAGGNGVVLELQTAPGDDGIQESFAAGDFTVATIAVWKGNEFGYLSMGSQSGGPIEGLVLSPTDGKLVGSFEAELSGRTGKMRARADFSVALPK